MILDLQIPSLDGLSVCREARAQERTQRLPIIMLTARGEETDRIVGLEMGADDYVVKPFSPKELHGAHPRGACAARRAPPRRTRCYAGRARRSIPRVIPRSGPVSRCS